MKTYESHQVTVPSDAAAIFAAASDMRNMDRLRDQIPAEVQTYVQEMTTEPDVLRIKLDGLGQKMGIRIVDRITNDTIKYGIENMPVAGNVWLQMKQIAPSQTRIKITLKAEIPMMLATMLGPRLQDGLNKAADAMANINFNAWMAGFADDPTALINPNSNK